MVVAIPVMFTLVVPVNVLVALSICVVLETFPATIPPVLPAVEILVGTFVALALTIDEQIVTRVLTGERRMIVVQPSVFS